VDTGATWLMGPRHHTSELLQAMRPNADCSGIDQIGQVELHIAGTHGPIDLSLSPNNYVDQHDGVCQAMLSPLEMPPGVADLWVIGQPVLRKYETTFDMLESRVGFGTAKNEARAVAGLTPTNLRHGLRSDTFDQIVGSLLEQQDLGPVAVGRGFTVAAEEHRPVAPHLVDPWFGGYAY